MNSGRCTFGPDDMLMGGVAVTGSDVASCFPSFVSSTSATICIGPFALAVSMRTVSYSTGQLIVGACAVGVLETVVAAKDGTAISAYEAKSKRAPVRGKFQGVAFIVISLFCRIRGRAGKAMIRDVKI